MYRLLRRILSSSEFVDCFAPLAPFGTASIAIFRARNEFEATSEVDKCDSPRDAVRDLEVCSLGRLEVAEEE